MAEEKMKGMSAEVPRPDEFEMATRNLMSADPDIQTVLVSRLSQMSPEELRLMDQALTPEVASVLLKLLPELKELIYLIGQQPQAKAEEKMEDDMPKDMGALGNM